MALKDLVLGYGRKLSWPQHVVLTAVFVAVTMALAMVFGSDLQAAMAFSGSTSRHSTTNLVVAIARPRYRYSSACNCLQPASSPLPSFTLP
eukprot:COSAG06_NODE_821_length_12096_cov_5.273735_13_plen_91_part_00